MEEQDGEGHEMSDPWEDVIIFFSAHGQAVLGLRTRVLRAVDGLSYKSLTSFGACYTREHSSLYRSHSLSAIAYTTKKLFLKMLRLHQQ